MKKILIQFDTDALPSSFDRVVAVDAGVDELFSYGGVTTENVEPLVHGAIFTRGLPNLQNTAIFIGGSQVGAGERLLERVNQTFFGPMRVSVMMDSNGSNTTAAAAVLAARKHVDLAEADVLILGGTGPVGHRAAQILAGQGAKVRVASRTLSRAQQTCNTILQQIPAAKLTPLEVADTSATAKAADGANVVIAAGAAGVELLPVTVWRELKQLKVLIDVNAVPPLGIGEVGVQDKAKEREGVICYGALGVGGTKMKIHKAAIARLFESNSHVLDTDAIYAIGEELA